MEDDFKPFRGNSNLKRSGEAISWTQEMLEEYIRCANDPIYFAEKYIKIVHVDRGLIPIVLYDYQKEIIEKGEKNRKSCIVTSRQAGKCLNINTKVTIRNKKTGKIEKITLGDLHDRAQNNM